MSEQHRPVGTLLRAAREAAGLTQDALARRAGVSARVVSDLERLPDRLPHQETLQRLIAALGLADDAQTMLDEAIRSTRMQHPRRSPQSGVAPHAPEGVVPATQEGVDVVGRAEPVPRARPATNLPHPATSLIGREREQEEVRALCARARVVTLTGAGGVGKTRLALAVGWSVLADYADGVWLVDLAAITDGALVIPTVLHALGLPEDPAHAPLEALPHALQTRSLLLILDCCEHLPAACARVVTALVRQCPGIHILATSQGRLQVPGEHAYLVPPLDLPDPRRRVSPTALDAHAAIRLFVDRARAVRPAFGVSARNAPAVVAICTRLDGLPLAIELAAARVSSLSVDQIAARLDDRFRLLVSGEREADPRRQTLRGALEWSDALLPAAEQRLLGRIAVFAGGWTLEAAEAVCAEPGAASWEVLEHLTALIQHSLVLLEEHDGIPRYRLLETVRAYAAERLQARGEERVTVQRHLHWCRTLAEDAAPQLQGVAEEPALARLDREQENMRAALENADAVGAHEDLVRLTIALWPYWLARSSLGEGRRRLDAALRVARAEDLPAALSAALLLGLGSLRFEENDYRAAHDCFAQALAHYRALDHPHEVAVTLGNLGKVARRRGEAARARVLLDEALALFRAVRDTRGAARTLGNLGSLAYQEGDYPEARAAFEACLDSFRELGDQEGMARAVNGLALARARGAQGQIALALHNLGEAQSDQGDYRGAHQSYREALALWRTLGAQGRIADCLEGLVRLAALQPGSDRERLLQAVRLCGAAAAIRVRIGAPIPPSDQARYAATLDALRAAVGEERCAAALAAGERYALEQLLDEVLGAS